MVHFVDLTKISGCDLWLQEALLDVRRGAAQYLPGDPRL